MITIDGSHGEGGGQIIRTALALSALTGKTFKAINIRSGRKKPGLKAQHLTCIRALEELSGSKAKGAELGSGEIEFIPGEVKGRTLAVDIGTAGSITLLLQSLLVPIIMSGKKVRLRLVGGTDVSWSMPIDYFKEILLPHLKKYAEIECKTELRGYFPKGQGKINLNIKGTEGKKEIKLVDQGKLIQIKGVSHASTDLTNAQVAERQAKTAQMILSKLDCPVNIRTEYQETASKGSGITLWAIFSKDEDEIDFVNPIRIGADCLGAKGKKAEDVGRDAAEKLISEIEKGAPVDEYLSDNLIPFMGLFEGEIKVSKISDHTKSNIYVVEKFIDYTFEVDEEKKLIKLAN